MAKQNITQERLQELLHYDPDTGVFTRIKSTGGVLKGSIAGSLHCKGYLVISVDNRLYLSHRLAWLYVHGEFPPDQIDHIDKNKKNNAISNLRCVDNTENSRNTKLFKNNTSGVCGVTWRKNDNKWQSQVCVNRKNITLGCYDNLFDAAAARKSAEISLGFHQNHGKQESPS